MTEPRWEHFEHVGDIGVRGLGPTKAAAFEQAALALTAAITDPAGVAARDAVEIACRAPDDGVLLADWLNAIIFEMATRNMLFARFAVRIEGETLQATAWGERVDVGRHAPSAEPKGATFTALEVQRTDEGGWRAECVIDV